MLRRVAAICGWFLALVPSGWQFFKWLLGWGEHIEFLAHRYHDIKYVGPMIEFLLAPPPWLALALVPPGLALVFWGNHSARLTRTSAPSRQEPPAGPTPTPDPFEPMIQLARQSLSVTQDVHDQAVELHKRITERKPKRKTYKNRRLLNVSPEALMEIYKDKTTMQGDAVAKEVHGKWLEYTGKIYYVDDYSIGSAIQYHVTFKHYVMPDTYYGVISAIFEDQKWKGRLVLLSPGQEITVIGKIFKIGINSLSLSQCEIVE